MPGGLTKKQLIIVFGGLVLLALGYYVFFVAGVKPPKPPDVTLTVWGPFSDRQAFEAVVGQYQAVRSNVKISYTQIDESRYAETVLNALATGQGPDVFMVPNRALDKYKGLLVPVPPQTVGIQKLESLFPTVVEQDFVRGGQIYALPFYLDTLALIYNKNALDQANIAQPPATWTEFQNVIPYLRTLNDAGQITKAAAAIGGSEKTVKNASDLLALLMQQNGVPMTDPQGTRAVISASEKGSGLGALNFYLSFANAAAPAYTWNDAQPFSLDALGSGRVAMIFGYAADLDTLHRKNPLITFGTAPMPQTDVNNAVNAARYWALGVSKQSKNAAWGWDFVATVATTDGMAKAYTDATKRLPALRTLISQKFDDVDLGVFAREALTARSWMQPDDAPVRDIMSGAVAGVLSGQFDSNQALRQMEDQISQLMAMNQNIQSPK
ncbi:MAG TPA: extracellular solute-binding protein [Candidatus Paceibacterota bacterium]|nr:extracellular solute-binding protein [Candidatus Paceibacterota bacterium]